MMKTLFGLSKWNEKYRFETETIAELTPEDVAQRVKIKIHNGRITLRQWDEQKVQANLKIRVDSEQEELDTDRFWSLRQEGTDIVFEQCIQPNLFQHMTVKIDVEMYVPKSWSARVKTHNGAIEVLHFEGDVTGISHNGAITLHHIDGDVELTTHNGDVEANRISGRARLSSHNGDLLFSEVRGTVDGTTHNGKIILNNCCERLDLQTHNGRIEAVCHDAIAGDWSMSTHNGSIRVQVPHDLNVTFKLSTRRGKVRGNAVPVRVNGANGATQQIAYVAGDGRHEVSLETSSGNLDIDYTEAKELL